MKTLMIAALLGTVAAGGVAVAQNAAAPVVKPMKGDTNNDGKVSRTEFVKQAETKFATLDTDRDGALTRDEARMGHGVKRGALAGQDTPPPPPGDRMHGPGRPGGGMMRQDTNGDGRITRAEYDAETAKRFARMDTNGDGTVDATEMAALPGGGRMGARNGGRADGSGTLTRAEYDAQAGQRFARMDTNGDGVIDATELQARAGQRGGKPRPAVTPVPPAPTGA